MIIAALLLPTMPTARTVKQLHIQKARLARKLFSRQKSTPHVRYYTQRIFALNYLICRKADREVK